MYTSIAILIVIYLIIYPTYKNGRVYYGYGDHRGEDRKSFTLGKNKKDGDN